MQICSAISLVTCVHRMIASDYAIKETILKLIRMRKIFFFVNKTLTVYFILFLDSFGSGKQTGHPEVKKVTKRQSVTSVSTDLFPEEDPSALPLVISCEVYIDDVNSFSAVAMDFRLDFFLKHEWMIREDVCEEYEKQLKQYSMTLPKAPDVLTVPPSYIEYFWTPDTYLANSKSVQTPSKETPTTVLHIQKIGNNSCKLEYTLRLAAIVACQMDFHQYPHDVQVCPLCMRSFAFSNKMVRYAWFVEMGHPPMNPELKLLRHHMYLTKSTKWREMLGVNYSTVVINFIFERDINHHLIHVYAPSTLIVVLSWFNFWMGTDLLPGRITLCVTSLLALTTQFSGARQGLPPVAYINGLDIWMVSCMTMVIASLLIITIVKMMDKKQKDAEEKLKEEEEKREMKRSSRAVEVLPRPLNIDKEYKSYGRKNKIHIISRDRCAHNWPYAESLEDYDELIYETRKRRIKKKKPRDWVLLIDSTARIIFPLLFLIFNAVYWPMLLTRNI